MAQIKIITLDEKKNKKDAQRFIQRPQGGLPLLPLLKRKVR